jgi:hypothetical protein
MFSRGKNLFEILILHYLSYTVQPLQVNPTGQEETPHKYYKSQKKGYYMNTKEKFHIYNEMHKSRQLNDNL